MESVRSITVGALERQAVAKGVDTKGARGRRGQQSEGVAAARWRGKFGTAAGQSNGNATVLGAYQW